LADILAPTLAPMALVWLQFFSFGESIGAKKKIARGGPGRPNQTAPSGSALFVESVGHHWCYPSMLYFSNSHTGFNGHLTSEALKGLSME
jgi:hypothetical protein